MDTIMGLDMFLLEPLTQVVVVVVTMVILEQQRVCLEVLA
jgi:hypothetical protein